MSVLLLHGPVRDLRPARTFTDGQLFCSISATDETGAERQLSGIFCTHRLLDSLQSPSARDIYVWHRHVFAVKTGEGLIEDIAATKRSFLYRDVYALLLMIGSVVLAPYAAWVIARKLYGSLSFADMVHAIHHA